VREAHLVGALEDCQIAREIDARSVAPVRVLFEATFHHRHQLRRDLRSDVGQRPIVGLHHSLKHLHRGRSVEGAFARQRLIENGAAREDIRGRRHLLTEGLLGGHVWTGTQHHPGRRQRLDGGLTRAVGKAGETEIENGDMAAVPDHHIRRFEIAVDHADRVRGCERQGHLLDNPRREPWRHRPVVQ